MKNFTICASCQISTDDQVKESMNRHLSNYIQNVNRKFGGKMMPRLESNTGKVLSKVECKVVEWIHLAQN